MFVEVQGKGSGKTTKLVNDAYKHLFSSEFTDSICIVAYKLQIAKSIKNMILDKVKQTPNIDSSQYLVFSRKIQVTTDMFDRSISFKHIDKFYVDEFDYMDFAKIHFMKGSYYTTSVNPNKSIINQPRFTYYILDVYGNTLKRQFKIELLLNEDVNVYDFLNKFLEFNINKKLINYSHGE